MKIMEINSHIQKHSGVKFWKENGLNEVFPPSLTGSYTYYVNC